MIPRFFPSSVLQQLFSVQREATGGHLCFKRDELGWGGGRAAVLFHPQTLSKGGEVTSASGPAGRQGWVFSRLQSK